MQISHDLSTVGYEVISWKEHKKVGILLIRDTYDRPSTEALIHASQQLVALSIGILFDVSKATCISKTGIQLQLPDGKIYGTATVLVSTADAFSLGKINLHKYMAQIEWNFQDKVLFF
jgi:hypothetical protein